MATHIERIVEVIKKIPFENGEYWDAAVYSQADMNIAADSSNFTKCPFVWIFDNYTIVRDYSHFLIETMKLDMYFAVNSVTIEGEKLIVEESNDWVKTERIKTYIQDVISQFRSMYNESGYFEPIDSYQVTSPPYFFDLNQCGMKMSFNSKLLGQCY